MVVSAAVIAALLGTLISGLTQTGVSLGQQAWSQNFSSAEAQKNRDFTSTQNQLDRDFNASQAALQRDWSEYMSSTAYQRQMNDLKAAGLNPALMMSGVSSPVVSSGMSASHSTNASASSPGASVPNAGAGLSGITNAFNSALSATLKQNSDDLVKNFKAYLTVFAKLSANSAK